MWFEGRRDASADPTIAFFLSQLARREVEGQQDVADRKDTVELQDVGEHRYVEEYHDVDTHKHAAHEYWRWYWTDQEFMLEAV